MGKNKGMDAPPGCGTYVIKEKVIDITELGRVLWDKLWMVWLCAVFCAMTAFCGTKLLVQPLYTSTSTIYILSGDSSTSSKTKIRLGDQVIEDFIALSKSRPVVEVVIERLDLDTDCKTLLHSLSIRNPSDSNLLEISATDPDPEMAAEIANVMADVIKEKITPIINMHEPSIVETAVESAIQSNRTIYINTLLGGILGAVTMVVVILGGYLADGTIRNEEDVWKYLKMGVLAEIPLDEKS